jgi:hypothetical protein
VGKPSYSDLERALILGHKRRLNINFPKEKAFTMIVAAVMRARAERKLSASATPKSREDFSGD